MVVVNSRFLTQHLSGVQRYALEVSAHLHGISPDVRFCSPKNTLPVYSGRGFRSDTFGWFSGQLWEQVELPNYLYKNGHAVLLNLSNTAPLTYDRSVVVIHDLSFMRHPEWFSRKFYYFYRALIPLIAKSALHIITDSNFSKTEILSLLKIPDGRVAVVAPGGGFVNNRSALRRNNSLGRYILTVSSINPRKNLAALIKAFNKIGDPDLKLVVVGEYNSVFSGGRLHEGFVGDKRIVFAGYLDDARLVELYSNALCFVYPSLYEGFGLPPLEAMSCGCPVVSSDVASLPEVCGDAAEYVDPYSIDDIARGVVTVLNSPSRRAQLISRGAERVKMFSWRVAATKVSDLLKSIG